MQPDREAYMHQCIALAEIALKNGNPPVGSVIVAQGGIIGRGVESGKSSKDITNHAEILAIRDAISRGYLSLLCEAEIFSTHEPCIMCSYVIRHHRIPRVVYGSAVSQVGGATSKFDILGTEDVTRWGEKPQIIRGVCLAECEELMARYAAATEEKPNEDRRNSP